MLSSHPFATPPATYDHLVITIPDRLQQGETCCTWSIKHGIAKLQLKYSEFRDSLEFDGYVAARAAESPAWRNRIEMADLLMTRFMQSQIERRPGAIEAVMENRSKIETALAMIPADLDLEQAISDQTWHHLESLFVAFRVSGVALATMTKVLSMKRPALIPMIDDHVRRFLFRHGWPRDGRRLIRPDAAAGVRCMKQFRELMQYERNLQVLTAIRNEMSSWFVGRTASSGASPALSLVRVLDSLLWYDWQGCENFGKSVLERGLSIPELVLRLVHSNHVVRWRAARALG